MSRRWSNKFFVFGYVIALQPFIPSHPSNPPALTTEGVMAAEVRAPFETLPDTRVARLASGVQLALETCFCEVKH